jgi:hypothetical protein
MQYQLVLQFPLSENLDFDALIELETKLTFELGSEHDVDGHDFGSGEMNIFIHTNNPDDAFKKTIGLLSDQFSSILNAAYRKLDSDQYIWLHPANSREDFHVA